ncbi:hypothetical protein HNR23_004549 [Nocardiopsis mwathae]|uniref:Uncharacterized protein n=2 Tax=Nocardiopsis mwathae TaxID=1472723 RepID=A0A7W9YLR9_9ACTN|nr:hypothetical protein [Nocardiopsis mwathae]
MIGSVRHRSGNCMTWAVIRSAFLEFPPVGPPIRHCS